MPLVIDASFAAGWFLPDEANVEADEIARRLTTDRGLVPCHQVLEFIVERRHCAPPKTITGSLHFDS